jgi:hypothetical protein
MHITFKIIKFYFTLCCSTCFGHHFVHHQELVIAAHAVSGPRVAVTTEQGWRKQPTQHHTGTRDCMCSNNKLLMMDKMVSETC